MQTKTRDARIDVGHIGHRGPKIATYVHGTIATKARIQERRTRIPSCPGGTTDERGFVILVLCPVRRPLARRHTPFTAVTQIQLGAPFAAGRIVVTISLLHQLPVQRRQALDVPTIA